MKDIVLLRNSIGVEEITSIGSRKESIFKWFWCQFSYKTSKKNERLININMVLIEN